LSLAKCAVSLSSILSNLSEEGREKTAERLRAFAAEYTRNAEAVDIINDLLKRLENALNSEVILKLVDGRVLEEKNYVRFFARLGQGGTRLTDDELVYSLIKDAYPEVHDRIEEIIKGPGRFSSEVDLVLGALRVAQALALLEDAKEWEKFGRPTPERVGQLHMRGKVKTEPFFLSMLLRD